MTLNVRCREELLKEIMRGFRERIYDGRTGEYQVILSFTDGMPNRLERNEVTKITRHERGVIEIKK